MKKINDVFRSFYGHPVSTLVLITGRLQRLLLRDRKIIYVSCFPKSGSSYATRILSEITRVRIHRTVYAFLQNEQDIYLPALIDGFWHDFATQQHTRATDPNVKLMNKYSIRPVVLVRNIFDIVCSFRDHLYNESKIWMMGYVTDDFFDLCENEQYDFIINLILPWYFNFYVSWYEAEREKKIEFLWITYEDMVEEPVVCFNNILRFLNVNKTEQEIKRTLKLDIKKGKRDKFNKGITGRGAKLLSEEQKLKIKSYKKYYPNIDFCRIGL